MVALASVCRVADETSPCELSIETDRLRLRVPTLRDTEVLYDLFADAEIMHGLSKEPVSAVEDVRATIEDGMIGY